MKTVFRALGASVLALAATAAHAAPSITGMWEFQGRAGGMKGMDAPPVTPGVKAVLDKRRVASQAGYVRNVGNILCLPTGFPQLMNWKSPIEVLESPGRVTIISEHDPGNDEPRSIYLNRAMPDMADIAPSWNGYSVGTWKGPVLTVTTMGFNDRVGLFHGVPRTEKTKITERISLAEAGKVLVDEVTMEDPAVLTGPWVVTLKYNRMPVDTEREEAVCEPDLEALKATDLQAIKDIDPDAARLLDPNAAYNPGSR